MIKYSCDFNKMYYPPPLYLKDGMLFVYISLYICIFLKNYGYGG